MQVELREAAAFSERAEAIVTRLRRDVLALVPSGELEHIGATSFGGGVTKGDVDVNLRVPRESFADALEALKANYEIAQPENWSSVFASFTDYTQALDVGIQVTVRDSEGDFLVYLRELLRTDPVLRESYDAVKRAASPLGMTKYREAKSAFFEGLLEQRAKMGTGWFLPRED